MGLTNGRFCGVRISTPNRPPLAIAARALCFATGNAPKKRKIKRPQSTLTAEELIAEQNRLIASAREFNQSQGGAASGASVGADTGGAAGGGGACAAAGRQPVSA